MHRALRFTSNTLLQNACTRQRALALPKYFVRPPPLLACSLGKRLLFSHDKYPNLVNQMRDMAADFSSDNVEVFHKGATRFLDLVFMDASRSVRKKSVIAMHREWRKSLQSIRGLLEADGKSTRSKWTEHEREAALKLVSVVCSVRNAIVIILGLSVVGVGTLLWIAFIK